MSRPEGMAIAWLGGTCGFFLRFVPLTVGFHPPGTQVSLYLSWSFVAANTPRLGLIRASSRWHDPATRFCAPLAHRSLVDLQFSRGAEPRMQFGPRVTWDISRGRISPTSLAKTWLVTMPSARSLAGTAWTP